MTKEKESKQKEVPYLYLSGPCKAPSLGNQLGATARATGNGNRSGCIGEKRSCHEVNEERNDWRTWRGGECLHGQAQPPRCPVLPLSNASRRLAQHE